MKNYKDIQEGSDVILGVKMTGLYFPQNRFEGLHSCS